MAKGKDHYLFGKKRPGVGGVKKGSVPWNKGRETGIVPKTSFKKGHIPVNKGNNGKTPCKKCGTLEKSYYSEYCRKCWVGTVPSNIDMLKEINKVRAKEYADNNIEEMRRRGAIGARVVSEKYPTSIEEEVYNFLKNKGILHEKQKIINGKFCVDVFIPAVNLVIEVDGDYWHSLDRVRKKDKAENSYLMACGFDVLRISEKEVNSGVFVEKLERMLV